eukprot:TRINITY_DN10915_c0_g1_i5.p1 TRINITY_DN10915_c0_g1~~TRINITY_DN10915_c0_g1_i5.p1  ORF type:complete len:392 (+),score=81.91 TRINITY_DN10915_c0_g1_i5:57-1232(+)
MSFLDVPDWGAPDDSFDASIASVPSSFMNPSQKHDEPATQPLNRKERKRRAKKQRKKAVSGEQPAKMAKRQSTSTTNASERSLVATRNWEVFDESPLNIAMETTADASSKPRKARRARHKAMSSSSSSLEDTSSPGVQIAKLDTSEATTAQPSPDLPSIHDLSLGSKTKKRKGKVSASERLQGARFRMLNEKLYTTSGTEAYEWFSNTPHLFHVYHKGFATQVERWPVNPVDRMIQYLSDKPASWVVADLGCGEAKIAASTKQKVYSFDLVACNSTVTACDIANLPLPDSSVDVCIFCLALMGVNYVDYLTEAHRVLRRGGVLKIAEVKSRITEFEAFFELIESIGYEFVDQNADNTHFIEMEFTKLTKRPKDVDPSIAQQLLQPCIYKRR